METSPRALGNSASPPVKEILCRIAETRRPSTLKRIVSSLGTRTRGDRALLCDFGKWDIAHHLAIEPGKREGYRRASRHDTKTSRCPAADAGGALLSPGSVEIAFHLELLQRGWEFVPVSRYNEAAC